MNRVYTALLAGLVLTGATAANAASHHTTATATPATTTPAPTCLNPAKKAIAHAASFGWKTAELTGKAKKAALDNFNAIPPVTNFRPSRLFVSSLAVAEDEPAIGMLVFADKDCITGFSRAMPLADLEATLAGLALPGAGPVRQTY